MPPRLRIPKHRLLPFRSPVLFDEDVVCELCRRAREGYRKRLKSETFGFLFGRLSRRGRLRVHIAEYYRGGRKSRTGVVFKDWPTILRAHRRRMARARCLRLRFLGNFHSHVEIAGEVFKGLSPDDRESFRFDPFSSLEVIAFVWRGPSKHGRSSGGTIVAYEPRARLNYRIRVYAKRKSGIRQVPARAVPADVAILF